MADQAYSVEVQTDFLEKITHARPIPALSEFIWNSLDADADSVSVRFDYNGIGAMSAVVVTDNGYGMEFSEAPEMFRKLGGSWKKLSAKTKTTGRFLHGQEGRGRFKAFSIGRFAEWDVTYEKGRELWTFKISINSNNIREVRISEEVKAHPAKQRGVILTITELHKDYEVFLSDNGIQEITEIFALYLVDYKNVSISVGSNKIDPSKAIFGRQSLNLSDVSDGETSFPVRLEIIEWYSNTKRILYLCNDKGFPFSQADRRFQVGEYYFSAYLKSEYISKLQNENIINLADFNPLINKIIDEAQQKIKDYFRERAAQEACNIVAEWKEKNIYPYLGDAATALEQVERQVFDIVAVNVAQYLPDFEATPQKNKAFHLRLLRQAIEKSPEDLQLILSEILKLPKSKQEELAGLLRDVSFSAIISAAKIVADRLKFLTGLESILFDADSKNRLKERSQLHRIIAQNCWLFGEEFNLSVDDQSLTEVLRKHRKIIRDEIVINEPVKHISKERGIIDLMLSRSIRRHKANELTHLVVELKAPKVKIDVNEVMQIEQYAFSVKKDERFRSVNTTWIFWVISDDYGDYAAERMNGRNGLIHEKENIRIYVKTWAQVLDENRACLQFFQERLEYQADKGSSLKYLQDNYDKFLKGVLIQGEVNEENIIEETE